MEKIFKILSELGPKGGIGLFLSLTGISLGFAGKIDFNNIGSSVRNISPATTIAILCCVVGLALLGNQIYDLREKNKASEDDRKILAKLVTQFNSHGFLSVPLEYENIGEVVDSVNYLRIAAKEIVDEAGSTLSRSLAERSEFLMQNFLVEIRSLERAIASTADAYISAYIEGREVSVSHERQLYEKLRSFSKPIFSSKNNLVVSGANGINLCDLSPDFALTFVRELYRMRGGFQEIFYQIQAAGVPIPERMRLM